VGAAVGSEVAAGVVGVAGSGVFRGLQADMSIIQ